MAKKKAKQDGEDLAILHPEREITVGGRKLTVREYGFVEGLRLAAIAAPIVQDLAAISGGDGTLLGYAALQTVFANHADAVVDMIAQACDQPRDWIAEHLSDGDGQALLMTWWAVNGPFFVRRVVQALQMRAALGAFAGAKSTPPSSRPATTPSASGTTHAVN